MSGVESFSYKCPICGKEYKEYKILARHLSRVHNIKDPDGFLSLSPESQREKQENVQTSKDEPIAETEQEEQEREVVLTIKGLKITKGDIVRAVVSRNVYIFKVLEFTESLPIVVGEDIYGNQISIDLRKAIVLSKLLPEKFDVLRERAREIEFRREKKKKGEKE